MTYLKPEETNLIGEWIYSNNKVIGDATCIRIEKLIKNYLVQKVSLGWNTLYIDPEDARYWELTYPKSYMHGGGPPKLTVISKEIAEQKYKIQPAK